MHFDIITLFPESTDLLSFGVLGRAIKQEYITIKTWNPRDYSERQDGRIDDRPYGGGPGMVMQYEPIKKTIEAAKKTHQEPTKVIYLSPQGTLFTQDKARQLATTQKQSLILLAGRYEGIDERLFETIIDEELSIGDYVLTGGELPAMIVIDAITRLLPNVLGDEESANQDSFSNGILDHPHYTRPESIDGLDVPKVLLSGNHEEIAKWRHEQALKKTQKKRPELFKQE